MAKRVGGRGSAPDPAGGAYDAPPDLLVGWGGDTPSQSPGTPLPRPHPRSSILGAFGASNFAPLALNFGVPIVVNLRNDHCRGNKCMQHLVHRKYAQELCK